MFKSNQSKTIAILSLVALLTGVAQQAAAEPSGPQYSTGYEELECGSVDTSYLAAPST